jgi:hypothetical protein
MRIEIDKFTHDLLARRSEAEGRIFISDWCGEDPTIEVDDEVAELLEDIMAQQRFTTYSHAIQFMIAEELI